MIFSTSVKYLLQKTAFGGCFDIITQSSYLTKVILLSQKWLSMSGKWQIYFSCYANSCSYYNSSIEIKLKFTLKLS